MNRRLLVAIVVAGVFLISVDVGLILRAHDLQPSNLRDSLGMVGLGGVWIATGLVAWQRRPANRVGLLMVALGFIYLLEEFHWNASLPYLLFVSLGSLEIPVTVHLFLAFPSGRLETNLERRLAGSCTAPGSSLANVVKHAHASRAWIEVARSNGRLAVQVADDGTGGADATGAGLRGLRDRVEALDGRLQVDSPTGGGTRVTAAIPCT